MTWFNCSCVFTQCRIKTSYHHPSQSDHYCTVIPRAVLYCAAMCRAVTVRRFFYRSVYCQNPVSIYKRQVLPYSIRIACNLSYCCMFKLSERPMAEHLPKLIDCSTRAPLFQFAPRYYNVCLWLSDHAGHLIRTLLCRAAKKQFTEGERTMLRGTTHN
jgi:hypothetical protein